MGAASDAESTKAFEMDIMDIMDIMDTTNAIW